MPRIALERKMTGVVISARDCARDSVPNLKKQGKLESTKKNIPLKGVDRTTLSVPYHIYDEWRFFVFI